MKRSLTLLLGIALLFAGTIAPAQEPASSEESVKFSYYIFQTELPEDQILGIGIDNEELADQVGDDGVTTLASTLKVAGKTKLIQGGQGKGIFGSPFRQFSANETPYVSTRIVGSGNGTTMTQSTVSDGVTVELLASKIPGDGIQLKHSIDLDLSYPVMTEETQLVGRSRIQWNNTTILQNDDEVVVGRFTRLVSDNPIDYILVIIVEREDD